MSSLSKSQHFDVAVVGAGIVGLAHAWRAAARGLKVVVCDRTSVPSGASIRNFGMVWPIGQPFGRAHALAMRSRESWLEVASDADIWVKECGSLHLAHRDDEWAVLNDFRDLAGREGVEVELLSPSRVQEVTPAANPDGLLGGMWSPTELCVNPRHAIQQLARWLPSLPNLELHFDTTIVAIEGDQLRTSEGRVFSAERKLVCSGTDFETLFPEAFRDAGLRRTKLQMMRTVAQPAGWKLGPHLASGLTLRHYASFEPCPSHAALRERISAGNSRT